VFLAVLVGDPAPAGGAREVKVGVVRHEAHRRGCIGARERHLEEVKG